MVNKACFIVLFNDGDTIKCTLEKRGGAPTGVMNWHSQGFPVVLH